MKRLPFYAALCAAALLLMGGCTCTRNVKQGNEQQTPETSVSDRNFYGTYAGTLPAADCDGIQVELTLNSDTTYDLHTLYLKEGETVETISGVYESVGKEVIALIRPSTGERTYYRILKDAVALSDSEGNLSEGELADLYVLKLRK